VLKYPKRFTKDQKASILSEYAKEGILLKQREAVPVLLTLKMLNQRYFNFAKNNFFLGRAEFLFWSGPHFWLPQLIKKYSINNPFSTIYWT